MKIQYLGPDTFVNVEPYGRHPQGEVKDYPDEFAKDLLATSKRQQFVPDGMDHDGVIALTGKTPEEMTVAELSALLGTIGVEIQKGSKKSDLVALVYTNTKGIE